MSLLRDLQALATDEKTRIQTILLKAQVLASRLDHQGFADWLEYEVSGYPDSVELPAYRKGFIRIWRGDFANLAWRISAAHIPLSAFTAGVKMSDRFDLRWPISSVEEFANSKEEVIKLVAPAELVRFVELYEGMQCTTVWEEVSRHAYRGLIDAVRAKILRYSLEIEKTNPKAGEAAPGERPVAADRLDQLQQTVIYGATNYVSIAGRDSAQQVGLSAGDLGTLVASLRGLGLAETDIEELRAAVIAEPKKPAKGFGPRVQAWLGTMMAKAAEGTWQVAAPTGAQVLATLLLKYYGPQ